MEEAKNLTENSSMLMATVPSLVDSNIMDSIKWPYWIVAIGHIIYSFGYIAVIYLPHKMPIHDEDSAVETANDKQRKQAHARSCSSDLFPIISIIFLYAAGCGSERLFQSMQVRSVYM